ncbi:MAG: hypothetical protein ABI216_13205 [Devosia sp.]
MLRALIILSALAATPAFGTEWVHCADPGGAASFDFLSGDGLGVLSIVGLTITAGEKVWASAEAYGPGDPVSVGQQFEDESSVRVDAMDKDFVKIAELRLFKTLEGDSYVTAGTLRIVGMGAWAVICEGP